MTVVEAVWVVIATAPPSLALHGVSGHNERAIKRLRVQTIDPANGLPLALYEETPPEKADAALGPRRLDPVRRLVKGSARHV